MTDNKEKYPKEIVTFEKITEDSEDITEVVTIVNNEYEEKAVNVAVGYQAAFNRRDITGCDEMLNFPHTRLGMNNNEVIVTDNPPQIPDKFFNRFVNTYGWNHSTWDYRRVVQSGPLKIHLLIQFSRYRIDGTKIGSFPSLWVITNQNEHWGIKMRSSFAP